MVENRMVVDSEWAKIEYPKIYCCECGEEIDPAVEDYYEFTEDDLVCTRDRCVKSHLERLLKSEIR